MIDRKSFLDRREALRRILAKEGGVIILPANNEAPMNYPSNVYRYRQDSTFRYFFSACRDGFWGVMDIDSGEDTIFGDDFSMDDIIWMGDQPTVKTLALESDVEHTSPLSALSGYIASVKKSGRKIHFLPPYRHDLQIEMSKLLGIGIEELKDNSSISLIKAVVELRLIKSEAELSEIDEICNTGVLMHQTVMKNAKVGRSEQYLAGLAEGVAISYGRGISFPVILSQNGQTLHNPFHEGILDEGRLLLVDMGAESATGYCSDYTRTLPVGGRFTSKQREIYEIVLKANMESIAYARPGIKWQDVHFNACRILAEGLISLGLMKGNAEEAVALGATSLFMPHGLGHAMGMDVHDMEGLGETFVGYDNEVKRSSIFGHKSLRFGKYTKVGNVLTVEPGIYFIPALIEQWKKEKKFENHISYEKLLDYYNFGGIRIEDDIVITDDGCRVLGNPLQKSVADIEEFMRG